MENTITTTQTLLFGDEAPGSGVDWKKKVPTVSQLTRSVRGHLESAFQEIWVRGEISNFRKPASGHAYLILKDATAQLRTVLFRPVIGKLRFALEDGMEVLVRGRLSVYEARGEYQLIGDHVEPVGQGALQLAFEQLKARLLAEGLFEAAAKKPIPAIPRRIGIVTSSTGAAVRDILKVLHRRFPNLDVIIFPAIVQGDKAAADIANAIAKAQTWNEQNPERAREVLIVGRGGGSLEDLWCFNEEAVARAIFACKIPIISAVGHEVDVTIADFVADLRAPTPSAAAEMLVPAKADVLAMMDSLEGRLERALLRSLEQLRMHATHLASRLVSPRDRIRRLREQLTQAERSLQLAMRFVLENRRKRFEKACNLLNALSPLGVLGRGYSITARPDGRIVCDAKDVAPGDRLITRLCHGTVESVASGPAAS